MKNGFFIATIIVAMLVGFAGCDFHSATYIKVSPNSISAAKMGKATSVNIDTDGRKWSVKQHPDWADISQNGNKLFVEVQPNHTGMNREGTIIITSSKQVAYVNVKQNGLATSFAPTDTRIHFDKNGGNKSLYMSSDGGQWKATTENSWLTAYSNKIDYSVSIYCEKNTGDYRKGKVTVKEDNIHLNIEVTQGGTCDICHGSGQASCGFCGGMGRIYYGMYSSLCPSCGGYGSYRCTTCGGSGERE